MGRQFSKRLFRVRGGLFALVGAVGFDKVIKRLAVIRGERPSCQVEIRKYEIEDSLLFMYFLLFVMFPALWGEYHSEVNVFTYSMIRLVPWISPIAMIWIPSTYL